MDVTFLIKTNSEEVIEATKELAIPLGVLFNFFPISKLIEEASCPNSIFGGFLICKLQIDILGRSFFIDLISTFWHSSRNILNGFSALILQYHILKNQFFQEVYFNLESVAYVFMDAEVYGNTADFF